MREEGGRWALGKTHQSRKQESKEIRKLASIQETKKQGNKEGNAVDMFFSLLPLFLVSRFNGIVFLL